MAAAIRQLLLIRAVTVDRRPFPATAKRYTTAAAVAALQQKHIANSSSCGDRVSDEQRTATQTNPPVVSFSGHKTSGRPSEQQPPSPGLAGSNRQANKRAK